MEHLRDLEELKMESHMLRHYFDCHMGENMDKMKFGGRILKQASSAFNRQICESVRIQAEASSHYILNSKSEYNRCALPRLTTKLGEVPMDKLEEIKKKEIEKEKELKGKIRDLKIKQGFTRRNPAQNKEQPARKRRKIEEDNFKRVEQDDRRCQKKTRNG